MKLKQRIKTVSVFLPLHVWQSQIKHERRVHRQAHCDRLRREALARGERLRAVGEA